MSEGRTVEDYVTAYIRYLQDRGLSEITIRNYASYIRRGLAARDMLVTVKEAPSVGAWQVAAKAISHWGAFMRDPRIVEEAKKIPKPHKRTRTSAPVPEDQWRRIVQQAVALTDPARGILLLLTTSGLRVGDVLRITRAVAARVVKGDQSVEIDQKKVMGERERTWAPSDIARQALEGLLQVPGWRTIRDLLVPVPIGDEVKDYEVAYHKIRKMLREICARADVPYARPHRFRHSYASVMHDEGESIKAIQAALGHTSERTTYTYVHVGVDRQQRAANRVAARVLGTNEPR